MCFLQTEQIFRNIQLSLDAAGAKASDVLKVTVYLLDVADRTKINVARQAFFGDARPASTLIGVKALAKPEFKVEIDDCGEPWDLTDLVVEASMWCTSKLRYAMTIDQDYLQLADNIGFEKIMEIGRAHV